MVGDHELGLRGAPASRFRVAATDEGAATAGAAVGADGELGPERRAGLEGELGAVARLGRFDPVPEALEVGRVLRRAKEPAELVDPLEALAAEVVLPPLEDGDPDISTESGGGGRHVLRQELFLERLRRRRDHDALAGERAPGRGRRGSSPCRSPPRPADARAFERVRDSVASAACPRRGSKPGRAAAERRPEGPKKASTGADEPSSGSGHHRTCVRVRCAPASCRKIKARSLRTFFPAIALTAVEAGQYAARARSGKPSGSPDLAFKDTYSAA